VFTSQFNLEEDDKLGYYLKERSFFKATDELEWWLKEEQQERFPEISKFAGSFFLFSKGTVASASAIRDL
jgi:hypothetical protein